MSFFLVQKGELSKVRLPLDFVSQQLRLDDDLIRVRELVEVNHFHYFHFLLVLVLFLKSNIQTQVIYFIDLNLPIVIFV